MREVEKYECKNFTKCGNYIFFGPRDLEYFVQRGFVKADGSVSKPKLCRPCKKQKMIRFGDKR